MSWSSDFGLLALASGRANPYLRTYLQERLSSDLGVAVDIGDLRGNPLKGFRMERVRLGAQQAPLLVVDAVEARYRPATLLRGPATVDRLVMVAPRVRLPEGTAVADSAVRLLPESDPNWWKRGPRRGIRIRHAEVVDGRIDAAASGRCRQPESGPGAPGRSGWIRTGAAPFPIPSLRSSSRHQDLSGLTLLADGRLTLDGIRLQTPGSHVRIDGTMTGLSRPEFDFVLRADSLAYGEINRILPRYLSDGKSVGSRQGAGRRDPCERGPEPRRRVSPPAPLPVIVDFSRGGMSPMMSRATATGIDLMRGRPPSWAWTPALTRPFISWDAVWIR